MTCLVCVCAALTEAELLEAIQSGASEASVSMARAGAGLTCGDCRPDLEELIEDADGAPSSDNAMAEKGDHT